MTRAVAFCLATACSLEFFQAPAEGATSPSRIAVGALPPFGVGLDFEAGLAGTPFRYGGLAQVGTWGQYNPITPAVTGWGGFTVYSDDDSTLSLMLGLNYSVEQGVMFVDRVQKQTNFGLLVAASYFVDSPRFWMRLTPQNVFALEGLAAYPGYIKSGIPWVEVGVHLLPWLSLGIGASYTPLRLVVAL